MIYLEKSLKACESMINGPYCAQINKLCTASFLEEHVSQRSTLIIYIALTITIQNRFNRTYR